MIRRAGVLVALGVVSLVAAGCSLTFARSLERSSGAGFDATFGFPFVSASSHLEEAPADGYHPTFNPLEQPTTFDGSRFLASWAALAFGLQWGWMGLSAFWRRVESAAA